VTSQTRSAEQSHSVQEMRDARDEGHEDDRSHHEQGDEIDAGNGRINCALSHGLGDFPIGGNGSSGIGKEGFYETIVDFVRTKTIVLKISVEILPI
jgi:acyl-CoA reductase-like NAD-dependent aldehyde dehydrogenase